MKQQILFVDDEPNLLHGLRRMLRPMRQSWDMHFADSGPAALEIIDRQFCDVVVSDMRMPGMDGSQLLDKVRQYSPETIRLILSGHSDPKLILRSVGPTHQFLAKPCDADELKTTLDRVCHLRHMLPVPSLVRMVTGIERLPSMPSLYHQVVEVVQEPADSLATMAPLIACDLGMTAKILQIVHSAFFGLQRHLSSPIQAVEMLGFDILQALVLDAQVFVAAEDPMPSDPTLQTLWSRSLAIALCAQEIMAATDGDDAVLDDAFSAGLLHDVGTLVFMSHLPERYDRSRELITDHAHSVCAVECDVIGASHAQVGAYLMGLWGLPDAIIDALAYHHQPSACPTQTWSPLSAVHIAEVLVHERKPHLTTGPAPILDTGYLETLGLQDCLPAWRQCAQAALQRHHRITEGHLPFYLPQEVAHA
jgi:HD-like signal output (HDOD) protein/ActR/RegA family two-component response regulator